MTRIKNCPVELAELTHWITAWRSNRELAFSAMPDVLYAYLAQEQVIDHEWDLNHERATELVVSLGGTALGD